MLGVTYESAGGGRPSSAYFTIITDGVRATFLELIDDLGSMPYQLFGRQKKRRGPVRGRRALSALKRRLYPHGEMNFWAPARRMGCRTAVNTVSKVK